MTYTIQEMVTKVGLRIGVRVTQAPVGSQDFQVQQLLECFNEEVSESGSRFEWADLMAEASFATIAAQDQGVFIGSGGKLVDADAYNYVLNDTMWDRTSAQPIAGPNSSFDWQARQALGYTTGPFYNFRIRGNHLLMLPIPPAGHDIYFEYSNKKYVYDPDGDTYGPTFTTNDSVPVLDGDLIMQGVRWRWKMLKGFPYAEEQRQHQLDLLDASSREGGGKQTLSLDGGNSILNSRNRMGNLTTTQI